MLPDNVTWDAFVLRGRKFISFDDGRRCHIFSKTAADNYGAWRRLEDFKRRYRLEGEALNLGASQVL